MKETKYSNFPHLTAREQIMHLFCVWGHRCHSWMWALMCLNYYIPKPDNSIHTLILVGSTINTSWHAVIFYGNFKVSFSHYIHCPIFLFGCKQVLSHLMPFCCWGAALERWLIDRRYLWVSETQERKRDGVCVHGCACVRACACTCPRERETERERFVTTYKNSS